jgi:hypothetical protein
VLLTAWSLCVCVLLGPTAAAAHPQITFGWSAPVPAFSFCPDAPTLRRHLADRAPREALRRRVLVMARVSRPGARFQMTIRIRRGSAWTVSQHDGDDCEALAVLALNQALREASSLTRPGTTAPVDRASEGRPSSDGLPPCAPDPSPVLTRLCDPRERFDPGDDFSLAVVAGVLVPRNPRPGPTGLQPTWVLRFAWSPWFSQSAFVSIAGHLGLTIGVELGAGFRLSGARALDLGRRWILAAAVGVDCALFDEDLSCDSAPYVRAVVRREWSWDAHPFWVALGPTVGMRGVGIEASVGLGVRVSQ